MKRVLLHLVSTSTQQINSDLLSPHDTNSGRYDTQLTSYVLPFVLGKMSVVTSVQETQMRQLKVEDALAYLEKVKTQFGDQPKIYNQFLDIMKNFKCHAIDTPGVIQRVSELFVGHNDLIVGFNTFLPPGYKVGISADGGPPGLQVDRPAPSPFKGNPSTGAQSNPASRGAATTADQQPEFDTAINYVTKIKKRFSEETGTYKHFLEILHTYQKEQRNIKQVLDEVSHLFRDHPDLLKEFTYFLPDAVQDVARVRLTAAAARSERRLLKQRKEAKRSRDTGKAKTCLYLLSLLPCLHPTIACRLPFLP
jgi:paired amphipathic helix protein Sin3a